MTATGQLVLALDFGGTKLAAALVDSTGRIIARTRHAIDKADAAGQAARAGQALLEAAGVGWDRIAAAGAIVPGIYYAATGNVWAPNLFGWDPVPFRQQLAARLPAPVTLDSDRAGAVVGEQWLGIARGLSDVVFLAVGTGIGAGIVSGGSLLRGASGIAGSAGWFALTPEKSQRYRRTGCWEAEAAGPALARRAGMASADEVVAAARRNDPACIAALGETARWLGMGIANLVSLLNPQMIVLGGGLMQAGDLLLEGIRSEMLEWAQPVAAREVRIELSQLGEDAGLLGAARLALPAGPAKASHVG